MREVKFNRSKGVLGSFKAPQGERIIPLSSSIALHTVFSLGQFVLGVFLSYLV